MGIFVLDLKNILTPPAGAFAARILCRLRFQFGLRVGSMPILGLCMRWKRGAETQSG